MHYGIPGMKWGRRKAKGEAWRNTAALVGAYAAVSVTSLYKATR